MATPSKACRAEHDCPCFIPLKKAIILYIEAAAFTSAAVCASLYTESGVQRSTPQS